jgi:hypothetical protein
MIEFSFDLCGGGLAEVGLTDEVSTATFNVTNDTDALGDLARVLVHILHYAEASEIVTLDPPAEYHWRLERRGHDGLSVEVVRHEKLADLDPGGPQRLVFDGRGGLIEFVREVVDAMTEISRTHGLSGYESLWESHEFPRKPYRELKRRLAKADRQPEESRR